MPTRREGAGEAARAVHAIGRADGGRDALRYVRTIALCSRTLLSGADAYPALIETLGHLRNGGRLTWVGLFENVDSPGSAAAFRLVADVTLPGVADRVARADSLTVPWLSSGSGGGDVSALADRAPRFPTFPWRDARLRAHIAAGRTVSLTEADPLLDLTDVPGVRVAPRRAVICPIAWERRWWGGLIFADIGSARDWSPEELRFLRAGTDHVAAAIRRWRTEAALRRRLVFEQAVSECARTLQRPCDSEAAFHRTLGTGLETLRAACGVGRVSLYRREVDPAIGRHTRLVVEACAAGVRGRLGIPAYDRVPEAHMPSEAHARLARGEPWAVTIGELEATAPNLANLSRDLPRSIISIPIMIDGAWWGSIVFLDDSDARTWVADEIGLLRTAADLFAATLVRWRAEQGLRAAHAALEDRVRVRTAELDQARSDKHALAVIATRVETDGDLRRALRDTLGEVGRLIGASRMVIGRGPWTSDGVISEVFQWQCDRLAPLTLAENQQRVLGTPWFFEQARHRRGAVARELSDLPAEAAADRAALERAGVRWVALRPLFVGEEILGALWCLRYEADPGPPLTDRSLQVLDVAAGLLSSVLQREHMRESLADGVAERTRELSALLELAVLSSGPLDREEVLEAGLARIMDVGRCDTACVHLLSTNDEKTLRLAASHGLDDEERERLDVLLTPGALGQWLREGGAPIVYPDGAETTAVPAALHLDGRGSFVGFRLSAGGDLLGLLSCYRTTTGPPTRARVALMGALADQLGVLLAYRRLQRRAEAMAITAERQRLARELHDAVTQSLYSQSLFARSARMALEDGDTAKVDEVLSQVEASAVAALREMRLLLYHLRPAALARDGYCRAVEERLDQVERRLGVRASLRASRDVVLDAAVEEALYHVTMESLNNALKHAGATVVEVTLAAEPRGVRLCVTDDGSGFDAARPVHGMGLANMRERLLPIGGRLVVDSAPGRGTRVTVHAPAGATGRTG